MVVKGNRESHPYHFGKMMAGEAVLGRRIRRHDQEQRRIGDLGVSPPINSKIDAICRALKEYGHGSHVSSSVGLKEGLFLCWDKLANGWCKSNTDGSWFQDINCECKGSY
ncbi:hypothetical protein Goarm_003398 [Gossypium armourianum]|uniref:Uncharacterized protein n=1 Tax=Gossypium armourianum TaxID=34283 RepID=A0A7J9K329_9ROSI|nr:hypothetical protein [Gossypium armourianum]